MFPDALQDLFGRRRLNKLGVPWSVMNSASASLHVLLQQTRPFPPAVLVKLVAWGLTVNMLTIHTWWGDDICERWGEQMFTRENIFTVSLKCLGFIWYLVNKQLVPALAVHQTWSAFSGCTVSAQRGKVIWCSLRMWNILYLPNCVFSLGLISGCSEHLNHLFDPICQISGSLASNSIECM